MVIAAGSVTAVAAYHLLSPAQIAQEVSKNNALSSAFESEDAITIGETQESNGFEITLLGIVSGKNLSPCLPEETKGELAPTYSYAAFAIAKSDGTAMEYRNFCIAPLIGGAGYLEYWIKDGEEFAITAISASGNEDGTIDMSTLQLEVVIRNNDGSFTEAAYVAKTDLTSYIYK